MTLVIAHRGASQLAPENTVEAYRKAVELGVEGIELDVRRSADDRLVIHHDARLPDGRVIRDTPYGELPEHVPDLAAALDACAGAFVNIEIKNDPEEPDHDPTDWVAERVADHLAERGGGPRWLVSSFNLGTAVRFSEVAPFGVRTAWLTIGFNPEIIATALEHGIQVVHPWVADVRHDDLRAAHAAGLAVNVWTCNDELTMRRLIGWGIDGICTDYPDWALRVRASIAG